MNKALALITVLLTTAINIHACQQSEKDPIDYETLQKMQKNLTHTFHKKVSLAPFSSTRLTLTRDYYNQIQELSQRHDDFIALQNQTEENFCMESD